ncbi:MBL fold metallo-hydrolase [Peribacillus sp. NPDC096379]|uniref:MBL fold metallo-hydrolase n=1 Tax=Peribacillus sp. NPDC096379 TaxID=3364393 RepID=UPI0038052CE5
MKIKYENLDGVMNTKSVKELLQWSKERRAKKKDLNTLIPQANNKQITELKSNRSKPSITWIGHSTFLLQLGGVNILTDPVWAKWQGTQKRMTEPGLSFDQLPDIDIVIISHSHYDHLDFGTIRRLPGNPIYYVPYGLKQLFLKKGYKNIIEANWWDSFQYQNLKLSFVPAQHWTRRSLFDTNSSHWGGWIIEAIEADHSIYFVGDTGYFRGFNEIAKRFKFNLKHILMPIGAYEPEWFMKDSHINPEEAVKAFQELGGTTFIPMHYGTYRLADDTGPEALDRLQREWRKQGLPEKQLQVLDIGGTLWLED